MEGTAMRFHETGVIAAAELRQALRSRWFVAAAICFLLLSLGLSFLGLAGAERAGLAGFDRTTASVLNLGLLFVPLVTLVLGALGLAGDHEDGMLAMLLAQPVTRLEVYAGKYFGLLGAIAAAIAAGFGATGVIVGVVAGGGNVGGFASLVLLLLLLAAVTLAIGTALSALLESRARAIGAAVAAWLFLVYVSDLGVIGLTVARHLAPGQVFVLALVNPVQEARVLGTLALGARLDMLGPVGLYGLDHFGTTGVRLLLVGALVAAAAVAFGAGYGRFRRTAIT
jgi:Cu-processing system permease protein